MPEAEIEIVRRVVDAWNRRDQGAILALSDPEGEYVNSPSAIEPGTRRGREGTSVVTGAQWEFMPGVRHEIDRFHDRGEEIITEGCNFQPMPGSEARITSRILIAWSIRDGLVTRTQILGVGSGFEDAAKAAGLRE